MPIGQAVQQIGQIDPSSLIGRADRTLVEPKATAALIDSFRQGVITADDIVNRIGQLGQAKKKAEIDIAGAASMQAQEAMSPEAQAARAQGLATQTATGVTAQAQAERTRVLTQYPAVAYFDKFAGEEGIKAPVMPDGSPDYKQMEEIGAELAVDKAKKAKALTEFQNIESKSEGGVTFSQTKQGQFVRPERVAELTTIIQTPFSRRQAPGTVESAASPAATVVEARNVPVSTENIDVVRARLAGTFGSGTVTGMDEGSLRLLDEGEKNKSAQMVVPRGTPSSPAPATAPTVEGTQPLGTPIPGVGFSTGVPRAQGKTTTAEQDKAALALGRMAESSVMQNVLATKKYDPTTYLSEINRLLPQVLKSGDQKLYEAATEAWAQGLLRLESGAAISVPEQAWYSKTFFPQVKDTAEVVQGKARLRANVERGIAEIAQKGGNLTIENVKNVATLAPSWAAAGGTLPPTAPGPSSAAPIILRSSGKKIQRNAQGIFEEVK